MIEIDIPGFGEVRLMHLVADYSGTLSIDGRIVPEIKERFNKLADIISIHILTADTHGKARRQLSDVNARIHFLNSAGGENVQKGEYVQGLGADSVIAIGNGNNDRMMLKSARIGVAVCIGEGCASDAYLAADMLVGNAVDALDLLLHPDRLKATLRY